MNMTSMGAARIWIAAFSMLATVVAATKSVSAACTNNLREGKLNIRQAPSVDSQTIAYIPEGSCRIAVETSNCQGKWCRVSYNGVFGWVNTDFLTSWTETDNRSFNYYILKAIYDTVGKRSGRGYDIKKSYSQDLKYPGSNEGVRRFWNDGNWVFPGGAGETMCVAAIAEVMIEAVNAYYDETKDETVTQKLTSDHFGARATGRHLRQHLWEYSGLGTRGAGHALERFGIGQQKQFSELVPGDFLKINRIGKPGHSTIFIAYLDAEGKVLEVYSKKAVGFLYFSAHGGGFDLEGKSSTGLSFKKEYFNGRCANESDKSLGRCSVIAPGSDWGPNMGRMHHPASWPSKVVLIEKAKEEIASLLYVQKTGKPLVRPVTTVMNSAEGAGLRVELENLLNREMSLGYVGNFDRGD